MMTRPSNRARRGVTRGRGAPPGQSQQAAAEVQRPEPAQTPKPSNPAPAEIKKEVADDGQAGSPQTKGAMKQFPQQVKPSPSKPANPPPKPAGATPAKPAAAAPAPAKPAAATPAKPAAATPTKAGPPVKAGTPAKPPMSQNPANQPKASNPNPAAPKPAGESKENVEPKVETVDETPATNGSSEVKEEDKEGETMDTGEGAKRKKNRKRRSAGGPGFVPKRLRVDPVAFHKNPLMALNEIKPGLKYTVDSVEGPPHNPKFTVSVDLDSNTFTGHGRSKQEAKHAAAQAALSSFVQLLNPPTAAPTDMDFTSDTVEVKPPTFGEPASFAGAISPPKRLTKMLQAGENKNPVMLLNELNPGLEYTVIAENNSIAAMRFTVSVAVNGKQFEGSGQSKKLAKAAAARAVLSSVYGVLTMLSGPIDGGFDGEPMGHLEPLPQALADRIAEATYSKFTQVMEGQEDIHKKWKVLASICVTDDDAMDEVTVIALSTGTKCINGEHISMNGAALNDCHAEILARRCFKDFLYTQLELHVRGLSENSILEPLPTGGFHPKANVKFHLFINTAPCGDARIFSPHEPTNPDSLLDKHPNRRVRGLLRSKIEAGEGTIPVKPHEAYQTYDAIQGGQRLLTMSCSDKLARWNVLGIQGALLNHYVEPIYLESLVLGSLFNPSHMYRAMGGRIQKYLVELNEPYGFHMPKMCMTSSMEARQPSKSPNHSMNWSIGHPVEIVNAPTGKLHNNQVSRLVRRQFFQRFNALKDKLQMLPVLEETGAPMYVKAKAQAKDYQAAKAKVLQAFKSAGLGCWVQKPDELGQFELDF